MSDGARTDRLVLNLTPEQVCWFVDNTTMNGGCDDNAINANKNGKLFSRNTIKATADAFRPGVISRASTTMILCPAKPATGEPKLFAEAYQKAASHAEGEKQIKMAKKISDRCQVLLNRSEKPMLWREVLDVCFWEVETGGVPNKAFVKELPALITPRGQNRAAVMISVCADKFGLSKSRGGRYGGVDLFEGDEAANRLAELTTSLSESEASLPASVFNFLSYKNAALRRRESHVHMAGSRRPGLYTVIQGGAAFVRQVYCTHENTPTPHVDEVLGYGWEERMFPTDEEVSGAQKKEVRRLQQKVAKYVGDELLAPGKSARFKGVAISTLAYACALKPGAHIVKVLLRRLLDEEEAALTPQANARDGGNPEEGRDRGKDNKQKIDFKGRRTESCLAQLFGLSARAQRSKELEDGILSAGVVNSVRTFAIMLAREDIIVILATSIATRQHCTTFEDDAPLREAMEDMQGMKGVLSEVHGLVSEQHAHEFLRNGRQLLKRLEEYTATSFRAFTAQLCKSDKALLTTINKQAMKGTLGSTEREGLRKTRNGSIDFRQSNKTKLDPGHGLLPHIATTAVDVAFNAKAWCEWEIHEDNPPREDDPTSGKRARTLATEFSVLVVDRFIAELSAGDGAHARASLVNFESLFAAVDPTGILFGVLKKNPDALSVDGQPFFDAARQEVVKQAARIGVPAVAKDPTVGGEDTGTTEEMQDDGPKGSQQSGRSERKENVLLTRTQRPDAVSVVNDPYNVSLIRSQRANAATIVSDPVRARFPLEVLRSLCLVETNGKRARGKSVTFTISNLDSDGDDGGNSDDDDKEELPMSTSLNRKATRSDEESDTCTGGGVDESALSAEPTNHRNGEAKGRAKRKQGTATGSREDPSDNSKRHATTNNAVGRVSQAEQHYESGEDFEDTPWTRPCCCCRCRRLFCCHF